MGKTQSPRAVFAGGRCRAGVGFKARRASVFGHLLQRRVDAQDDILKLVEFLRRFLFSQDCGSYLAAEFVRNGHDSMESLIMPRLYF